MTEPSSEQSAPGRLESLVGLSKEVMDFGRDLPPALKFSVVGILALVVITVSVGTFLEAGPAIVVTLSVVVVVALGLLIYAYPTLSERSARLGPPDLRASIGVLSFAELGSNDAAEALGDGFSEELITRLSRIDELRVKPRHAMLQVMGRGLSPRQIARKLRVHYLIEGAIRRHEDDCVVTAGVIQTWDEDQWRGRWQGRFSELFDLQAAVAEGVAEQLLGRLRGGVAGELEHEERRALREEPADSVDAHYAYMRGQADRRRFNNSRRHERFLAAERAFLEAVRLDDGYVKAWAELGFLYLIRWETEGGDGWLERSASAFRQAVQHEPDNPVASAELGYLAVVGGRTEEGFGLVEEAARRHPYETIPQNVRALVYLYLGLYESAVHLTERRVTVLDPDYVYPYTNAATASLLMGEYDSALRWAREGRKRDESAFVVWLYEGVAHFCKNRLRAAREAWERGKEVAPEYIDPLFDVTLAWIAAARGDRGAARRAAAEHRDDGWLHGAYDPFYISLCALAGEDELALDVLERQVTYAGSYRYLLADPTLRSLRDHPRFRRLLDLRRDQWSRVLRWADDLPVPPPELLATEEPGAT